MFIHMQMAKEKQNLLLVTFEKNMDKARFECYLLNSSFYSAKLWKNEDLIFPIEVHLVSKSLQNYKKSKIWLRKFSNLQKHRDVKELPSRSRTCTSLFRLDY